MSLNDNHPNSHCRSLLSGIISSVSASFGFMWITSWWHLNLKGVSVRFATWALGCKLLKWYKCISTSQFLPETPGSNIGGIVVPVRQVRAPLYQKSTQAADLQVALTKPVFWLQCTTNSLHGTPALKATVLWCIFSNVEASSSKELWLNVGVDFFLVSNAYNLKALQWNRLTGCRWCCCRRWGWSTCLQPTGAGDRMLGIRSWNTEKWWEEYYTIQ